MDFLPLLLSCVLLAGLKKQIQCLPSLPTTNNPTIHKKTTTTNRQNPTLSLPTNYQFDKYPTLDELNNFYTNLIHFAQKQQSKHHFQINLQSLGQTYEQRPIKIITIAKKQTPSPSNLTATHQPSKPQRLPIFYLECGLHAREWISHVTCMYTFAQIVQILTSPQPQSDNIIDALSKIEIWIIPNANPDGYFFSHLKDDREHRLWRKNREPTLAHKKCVGIDLNRNFPAFYYEVDFMTYLALRNPCSEVYAGKTYLSAAESVVLYNLWYYNAKRIKVAVPVHSHGQVGIIPYSYSADPTKLGPRNERYDINYSFFRPAIDAMNAKRRENMQDECPLQNCEYELGNSVEVLKYTASGASDDTLTALGICHVMTLELPPARDDNEGRYSGFHLEESKILSTVDEVWHAMRVMIRKTAAIGVDECF